jgi:histidinol-phosphate aminotransferase
MTTTDDLAPADGTAARSKTRPSPRHYVPDLPIYSSATLGEVPIVFRASSNESPFEPSDAVKAAVAEATAGSNRYPALHGASLVDALAEALAVRPEAIAVGDGSLSVLNHLLLAFAGTGKKVVHAWRSYEAYPISIGAVGALSVGVPNLQNHQHDLDALAAAVDDETDLVILCNPNNPTGTVFSERKLVEFLDQVPGRVVVVLDEAYREFVDEALPGSFDSLPLLDRYPNLVLLRTFSKVFSLAGFRVGYMVAHPDVIAATRSVMSPFPVSAPAIAAAVTSLSEDDYRREIVRRVKVSREEVMAAIRARGILVPTTHANFVWMPVGDRAEAVADACAAAGIAVRCFPGEGVRVSVGQPGLGSALSRALTTEENPR